jgi:hypothetical protein
VHCLAETKTISCVHTLQVTRFTQLAEFAIEQEDRKLKKSVSASHIPQSVDETDTEASISPTSVQQIQSSNSSARTQRTFGRSMYQSPSTPTLSPRKFQGSGGQKGLMERFLATRGKMGTLSSGFVTVKASPTKTPAPSPTKTPAPVPPVTEKKVVETPVFERNVSINNLSECLN